MSIESSSETGGGQERRVAEDDHVTADDFVERDATEGDGVWGR